MKSNLFVLLYLLTFSLCKAQVSLEQMKVGGYLSYQEFKTKSPSFTCSCKVVKRSKFAIIMFGGNDYKIISDSISSRIIRKDIWGFYDGKDFYINCYLFSKHRFYAKFESESENEIYFHAAVDPELNEEILMAGSLGTGIAAAINPTKRVKYIFYKRTGGVFETDQF